MRYSTVPVSLLGNLLYATSSLDPAPTIDGNDGPCESGKPELVGNGQGGRGWSYGCQVNHELFGGFRSNSGHFLFVRIRVESLIGLVRLESRFSQRFQD